MRPEDILASFDAKRFSFDEREFALNLFGVRAKSRTAGKFDDFICALRKEDGEWKVYKWEATVDASTSYLRKPINSSGTAGLVSGQYPDVWKIDNHNGWCITLCQRLGPVRVYRDSDRDTHYDYSSSSIQSGYFGINFHYDRNEPSGKSGVNYRASAGCQVFRRKKDHDAFMVMVRDHERRYENKHSYTLFDEDEMKTSLVPQEDRMKEAPDSDGPPVEHFINQQKWAEWIVDMEGRRDSKGRLLVYNLPSGDGGGSFEIAGINVKYHKSKAYALKNLIDQGRHSTAETEAKDYIRQYTSGVSGWHPDERVIYFLRDCAFNRGPTGAAKILQRALRTGGSKLSLDGKVGPKTKSEAAKYAAEDLIPRLLLARQAYERVTVGRSESSKFWNGLSNRWVNCFNMAMGLGDPLKDRS